MRLFMVTVIYTHKDGRDVEACALIGAPDAVEAIDAAATAVQGLPHCAKVLGGTFEEMGGDSSNAQEQNARAATHPTHHTVN